MHQNLVFAGGTFVPCPTRHLNGVSIQVSNTLCPLEPHADRSLEVVQGEEFQKNDDHRGLGPALMQRQQGNGGYGELE